MAYLDAWMRDLGGRRGRAQERVATDGLVFARTRHATWRGGDPEPHDHILVANLCHMADEKGGWKALDTAALRDILHAATAVPSTGEVVPNPKHLSRYARRMALQRHSVVRPGATAVWTSAASQGQARQGARKSCCRSLGRHAQAHHAVARSAATGYVAPFEHVVGNRETAAMFGRLIWCEPRKCRAPYRRRRCRRQRARSVPCHVVSSAISSGSCSSGWPGPPLGWSWPRWPPAWWAT